MKTDNCRCTMHQAHQAISRRYFLRASGMTLAGVTLGAMIPDGLVRHAIASTSSKRLLFLYLAGGVDVINTIVPYGDADYNTTNRPTLFLPPANRIDLNGFGALHGALADLHPLYQSGDLAIVHRVGYPSMTQSHFDGSKIWQFGDPLQIQLGEGWLYRYVISNGLNSGATVPVLSSYYAQPEALRGQTSFVNVANPGAFDLEISEPRRSKFKQKWSQHFAQLDGVEPYKDLLAATGLQLSSFTSEYASWDQANWNPKDPITLYSLFPVDDATNPPDPQGPNGRKFSAEAYPFFLNLKVCALSLLESDTTSPNGTRLAATILDGFDTHDGQGLLTGQHPDRLKWIAYGFKSLKTVFSGAALDNRGYPSIWDDVAVITCSEFGRTTLENGSTGTDHGQAAFSFVAGGQVNGGLYNCDASSWSPGQMFEIDGFYLGHRTDYRALFWEILRDHMGANPTTANTIFPGYGSLGLQELNLFGA
jgi:uncharacterized protein (DUF1501 family)